MIKIGIIDSGVDITACTLHQSVKAFCHIDDAGLRTDKKYHDPSGHGTFNSALLTGLSENGSAPIIPNAELYVCAAIEGQNLALKSLAALEWMLEQPIDILLMPFGLKGNTPVLAKHLQTLVNRGVLPIAAIGNEGAGRYRSPGCYSNVLSVGACDINGEVAAFSGSLNHEETTECLKPDVATLGVQVESPYQKIGLQNGSSMAAAVLAGHAAKLWQKMPQLTNHELAHLITKSASPCLKGQKHRAKYGTWLPQKAKNCPKPEVQLPFFRKVEYDRYIDSHLAHISRGQSSKKEEFIIIPESSISLKDLLQDHQGLELKTAFHFEEIGLFTASATTLSAVLNDKRVKLAHSTVMPFLSLG